MLNMPKAVERHIIPVMNRNVQSKGIVTTERVAEYFPTVAMFLLELAHDMNLVPNNYERAGWKLGLGSQGTPLAPNNPTLRFYGR